MRRTYRLLFDVIAATFAAVAIFFLLALWLVFARPFASTDFSPLIASSIETLGNDVKAYVPQSVLAWNNEAHAIVLESSNVEIKTQSGARIATIGQINARVGVLNLLRGRFIPSAFVMDDVTVRLRRDGSGHIALWSDQTPSSETSSPGQDVSSAVEAESLRSILDELTHKNLTHDIALHNVHVVIHDEGAQSDLAFDLPEASLMHQGKSLVANLTIRDAANPKTVPLRLSYLYSYEKQSHHLGVHLTHLSPARFLAGILPGAAIKGIDLPLTGQGEAVFDKDLRLSTVQLNLKAESGLLTLPDLWEQPRSVKNATLALEADAAARHVSVASVAVDFNGPHLSLKAQAQPLPPGTAAPLDTSFEATVQLASLPMDTFATVWPKQAVPNARVWIVENMHKGVFSQGTVTVKGRLPWAAPDNVVLDSVAGKVFASGGVISYMPGMPPVEGANAEATLDLDRMDVHLTAGGIGNIRIQPFTISMTDFQKNIQMIDIPLKLTGPVPDVLRLLDAPPLGYAKEIGLDPNDTQGRVDGGLQLRFPLLASLALRDVDVKANADLKGFGAAKLIPGLALSDGDLALEVTKDGYGLKGPLRLNGVPLQLAWQGRFGAETPSKPRNQAQITGTVSETQLKDLGLDPTPYMKGTAAVSLHYSANDKKKTQINADVDMKNAALDLDGLNWKKKSGEPGVATLSATLEKGKNTYVKLTNIEAPQLKAKGTFSLNDDGHLVSLDLQPLIVGKTNVSLHMTPSLVPGGAMRVSLEGALLDISGDPVAQDEKAKKAKEAAPKSPKKEKQPRDYTFRLDKVLTAPNGFLTHLNGHAVQDSVGWVLLDVHALADGVQPVAITLNDQDGKRHFSLTTDNFGGMLKGFGLTDTIAGGPVQITGESTPDDLHKIVGRIKIGAFKVSGLPVLVRLVSAASPFGFADLITGDTSFSSMRGDFVWRGDDLDLQQVRMAGSAYGLNVAGHLDLDSSEANLHGTLVPFSFINSILGSIPMLGDVITGGEGQGVLAASYSLTGSLDDPSIGVNPVSLLTPGFIRNLFFGENDAPPEAEKK